MIINEKIIVGITYKNRDYYTNKGYIISGLKLEIFTLDLKPTSHIKINCKCDICLTNFNIKCYNYYVNYNNGNIYTCNDCCHFKKELTTLKNYGVDNPSKSEIIKERKNKYLGP